MQLETTTRTIGASIQHSTCTPHALETPALSGNLLGDRFISEDPLNGGVRGTE